jgi:hypothetical protein
MPIDFNEKKNCLYLSILRAIIKHLQEKPKTLFLIDSLGAVLTIFFLFVILRNFNEFFGVPKTTLTYLSVIAACLCIYSTTCFFTLKDNWIPFIRGISIANLLYCIFSVGLIAFNFNLLTIIGAVYFVAEIVVILVLVYVELSVATAIKRIESNFHD